MSLVFDGLMLRLRAAPSTHSPAMKFFWMAFIRVLPQTAWQTMLAQQARTLVVKSPAGNQELHGEGVVAGAEPVRLVKLVRRFERCRVDLDAKARTVRQRGLTT